MTDPIPLTGAGTMLDLDTVEQTLPQDPGDHDRFSHYVLKSEGTRAFVMGTPVMALCGKVWVPTRDGSKYPICPECEDIYESLPQGPDED